MEHEIYWKPSIKQHEAFEYLIDKTTTEVLYGGGAGGGKSYLGCFWLLYCCMTYPGSRWLMGRAILKTLKESTLLTFFGVCRQFNLKKDQHYKYSIIEGKITFFNGSEIYLKDLFAYPSDPEFDELGSTEFTGAFIDEASQVTHKAYQIVMSRLRYKLDEFGIIPKILTATNPTKNFLYAEFYKPHKEGKLIVYRKFVAALVQDNPHISKHYVENLHKLDRISQERLLFGNWEYDDDPTKLFEYEAILNLFNVEYREDAKDQHYLTVDVARFGNDMTVIFFWQQLHVSRIWVFKGQNMDVIKQFIMKTEQEYVVPRFNVIIDDDGIGGAGLVDHLPGSRGFVNNASPIDVNPADPNKPNFQNLKSQCYFLLSDYVGRARIGIYKDIDPEHKRLLIEDLEQIKRKDADKDKKLAVTPKEEIKERIGRSTDFSDALMMRMWAELKQPYRPYIAR